MPPLFADCLIAQLPALRRYATALTGSIHAADDLVQDCIERALRQSHSLQDPQRMASWLRAILHNLFIDDLPANVQGAVECGWQGIVFLDAEDLKARLIKLGIRWE